MLWLLIILLLVIIVILWMQLKKWAAWGEAMRDHHQNYKATHTCTGPGDPPPPDDPGWPSAE